MGALWSTTADSGSSKREQKPLKVSLVVAARDKRFCASNGTSFTRICTQVTLYDGFAMKKALDDAVLKVCTRHLRSQCVQWCIFVDAIGER